MSAERGAGVGPGMAAVAGSIVPTRMYVGGAWRSSTDGAELAVVDPADERVLTSVPIATAADLDAALAAAVDGFARWRAVDAWTRSEHLRRVASRLRAGCERVASVLTAEQGKPLAQARGEVLAAADQFDWYADEARRIYGRVVDGHATDQRLLVRREPVGVVAAFTPWNFPALLPARKLAPALAAGCSIVVKPAEEAPLTALLLAEACHEAGIPEGVVNVVTGDPVAISRHLIAAEPVRKVSLTGSVAVGRELLHLAADGLKAVSMELGGHAPVIVLDDVDVVAVARACALGKYRNGGQVCIAASRFLVAEPVADAFEVAFAEVARSLRLGPGADPATDMGPLTSARRVDAVEALVVEAVAAGASLAAGGRRPPDFGCGFWYEPTVLTGATAAMRVMSEEPFGPVAPIVRFGSVDEAIALANATPYGLAGFVFTRDLGRAFTVSEALEVGMVGVNHLTIATAEAPFGGVKHSGFGREGGAEGIDGYTVVKYVNLRIGPP